MVREERRMGDSPEVVIVVNCATARLPRKRAVMMVGRILMLVMIAQMFEPANMIKAKLGTENGGVARYGTSPG